LNPVERLETEPLELSLVKKLAFTAIILLLITSLSFCVGELVLRLVSPRFASFRSSRFRQYDPVLGLSLIANTHVVHARGCFQGEVSVNRWGMRDRERSLEKDPGKFRIALVGDSLVEGVHVKPDKVMNIRRKSCWPRKGTQTLRC